MKDTAMPEPVNNGGISALLQAVAQLNMQDLDDFVSRVLSIRAARVAPLVDEQEASLMQRINLGLSEKERSLFDALIVKRQAETISSEEMEYLISLTEKSEALQAERMQGLAELATLKEVPIRELMLQLHIPGR